MARGDELRRRARERLRYWLGLKRVHGFYEINSPVYSTLTLTALVNLVDFLDPDSQVEEELRGEAAAVMARLLRTMVGASAPTPLPALFSVHATDTSSHPIPAIVCAFATPPYSRPRSLQSVSSQARPLCLGPECFSF